MSSPAQGGPSVPKEKEKTGLGKMLSRMRTVLRSGPSSRRVSTISAAGAPSAAPAAAATAAAAAAAPASTPAATKKPREGPEPTLIPKSKLHAERAQQLAERFGLELKPGDWLSTEGNVERVDKPVRMRVHRICHECSATFGAAKECPKCKCKKYTRYPPKKSEAEKIASRERRAQLVRERKENAPIVPDYSLDPQKPVVLKKPNKNGGPDLIHKKARQRVRRTCCECQTLFISGNKTCPGCSHTRCTDCSRDPSKKAYYPYGYPGDEFGKNSVPYYQCHQCKTIYPPNPEEGAECAKCQHKRSSDDPRMKPKRIEPEPDPEVLKSLQAKLSALSVK